MKTVVWTTLIILSFASFAEEAPEVKPSLKKWQETKSVNGKKVRVLKTSKSISTTIDVPQVADAKTCEVEISTDYWQEDERIKVETLVENSQCGASKGLYIVNVRTRGEDGETRTTKHEEAWSRNNDQAIKSIHTYSMNGDVELVRVRLRAPFNDSCICDEMIGSSE